jgi:hypothetical protein
MASYSIHVLRDGKSSGLLTYEGNISLTTKCWWDPSKKIPAATYPLCSATHMTTKKNSQGGPREAVFLPNVRGFTGIFVHMGTGPDWSDGCIVIKESQMLKLFNDIQPKNGRNVAVTVEDS